MKRKRKSYETHQRSIAKAVIYRLLIVISSTIVIYLATRKIELAIGLMLATNIVNMAIYYLYERFWSGIAWGRR